jgi:hypothetical protein
VTGLNKSAVARLMFGALWIASSVPALAESLSDVSGPGRSAQGVPFRILLREYLEFRVGSRVTIRSNAGQVVITASSARAGTQPAGAPRSGAKPRMPAATVVPTSDRVGATNVCLYLEGTAPSCSDLNEVAGQVLYTASNP